MVTNMCSRLQFPLRARLSRYRIRPYEFRDIPSIAVLAEQVLLSECQLCCGGHQGPMNYNLEAGFGRRSYRLTSRAMIITFGVGWMLLTVVVVLQDRAIEAQREIIQALLQDLHKALVTTLSQKSSSVPVVVHEVQLPSNQVQRKAAPSPDVQVRPSQPKVQANAEGSTRNPSSQGKNSSANTGRSSRQAKEPLPVRPPALYTDPSDRRRATFSI